MRGFKSFGNTKVSLPLAPGLTAIVGPNGSGKSNIIDAFCFVLGKMSAKTMRAERFSDLLFNGGNGHRPAPFAEVSLHFDNAGNSLPIDSETVTITRRVDRSGKCTYWLNKKRVSRQEIVDLLSKSLLDPKGHNFVMQGDIGVTIKMNPLERRAVIDDIAGIAEYDEKKEKALSELQRTETNLTSMGAIVAEVEAEMKRLDQQKNDALRYIQLKEKLDENRTMLLQLHQRIYKRKLSELKCMIENREQQIAEFCDQAAKIAREIQTCESEMRGLDELIERKQSKDTIAVKLSTAELRWRMDALSDQIDSEKREYTAIEGEIKRVQESTLEVRECVKKCRQTLGKLLKKEELLSEELKKLRVSRKNLVEETAELSGAFTKLRSKFDALLSAISDKHGRQPLITTGKTLGKIREILDDIQDIIMAFEAVLRRAERISKLRRRQQRLNTKITILKNQLDSRPELECLQGHLASLESRRAQLEQKIKELERELEETQTAFEAASEREREVRKSVSSIRKRRSKLQNRISSLKAAHDRIQSKIQELEKRSHECQIEEAELRPQLEAVERELRESKLKVEAPTDVALSKLENEIERLKAELQALEPVNMRAVKDFRDAERRYETLKRKYEKLEDEKQAILNFMEEIEQKKTKVFMETFEVISRNFTQIFSELSPGGTAKLLLENPERPLEGGLEIEARPAGKELTRIDAMSGGEKALTALAFIFAIQRAKPAALYLLDEIDAHLDPENLGRVAKMLQRSAKDSQVIVVTLRDSMMSVADRLFGVHMDKTGVSHFVSVELEGVAA
jgi:chromosome segregation ATPase